MWHYWCKVNRTAPSCDLTKMFCRFLALLRWVSGFIRLTEISSFWESYQIRSFLVDANSSSQKCILTMYNYSCRNRRNFFFFFSWETLIIHQARHVHLKLDIKRKWLEILRMMTSVHGHFPAVPRRTSPPDGSGGPQVPGADRAFRSGNYLSVVDPAVECAKHTNTSVFTHTAAQFVLVWK